MIKKLMVRLSVGLLFAVPLMLLAVAWTQAEALPVAPNAGELQCPSCHEEFHAAWEDGAHGQATADTTFQDAWQAQGQPERCLTCHTTGYDPDQGTYLAEGVRCEACHSPIAEDHPSEPMPSDRSATLCGTCHTETYFEWQASQHREVDLACSGCHDAHGTTLRAEDPSALCATCHRERASNFNHTAHSQVGLTCADCHLGTLNGEAGEGHATRDHSFNVKLSTCNSCHAYQMHDPGEVHTDAPTPLPPDSMSAVETSSVIATPEDVGPFGFAALAGLVGLGAGVVLAPWLERWYRRMNHNDR